MSWTSKSTIAIFAVIAGAALPAAAQQMGRDGYSFPARSPSMAAQFEFQQRMQNGSSSASSAGGLGALNQFVTQYSSSSTSIANMNQINQTLTDGSTATVTQQTEQASTGSQDSAATTRARIDNSITRTTTNNTPVQ